MRQPMLPLPARSDRNATLRGRGRRGGGVVRWLFDIENRANRARDGALREAGRELDGELLRLRLPQESPQQRDDLSGGLTIKTGMMTG